ncbi:hypothetical protein OQA88_7704 [Cercophora sp. LCS_1]
MPVPGDDPVLDAESMVSTLVGMSIAFVALSSIAVGLRLYTRFAIVRSPGADDATIAVAQVLSLGVSVVTILQAKYALGRHVWMVSNEANMLQLKCLFAAMTIYNLAQIVTKMSFLLQYRRIFQEGGYTRQVCLVLIVFLALWGITQEVLVGFACIPVSLFIPSQVAVCIDSLTVWYLTSIMNIVTDFIVFTVPLPAIRSLHLPRRQKILVTSIFCLGFFTCIISIVRLFSLHKAINTTDPTWDNVPSAYWSIVELNCGILCASLPTLRPLLRHWNVGGLSRKSRSDGYQREGSDLKGPFKGEGVTPGAGAAVYPLTYISTSGSQEGLQENAADVPSSSVYRAPDYASRHMGRHKSSRLANKIKGGEGQPVVGEEVEDRRKRAGSESGITVTRKIEVEKESMDGRIRRSSETESDGTKHRTRIIAL